MTLANASNHSGTEPGSGDNASFAPLPRLIFRDLMRSGCVSLHGPHRAGKTTLTLGLTRLWDERGGIVLYLDLRPHCAVARATVAIECAGPGGIMGACRRALLHRLGQDPTAPIQDQRFQQDLSDLVRRQRARTLLVLDHWDELPGDIAQELLVALRAALQEQTSRRIGPGGVHLLLVSARGIAETAPGVTGPFLSIAMVHWLPDLSADAARKQLCQGLRQQGLEAESDAADWLTGFLGGDRDLIARALACMGANGQGRGARRINLDQTQNLAESMLLTALEKPLDWPLTSEILTDLRSHRVLLDVMSDLLAGRQTSLHEIRRDTGVVEASGFVRKMGSEYRFRSPFHETLAGRLLTRRTWGDLAVLHHDWQRARDQYQAPPSITTARAEPFAPHELGMALATCLLRMGSTDEILLALAEMLALCIQVKDVHILTVRGKDPRQFLPLGAMPTGSADLFGQIDKCVQSDKPQVSRVAQGQRWVLPLIVQGADRTPYTHWSVLFTSEADWPGPALEEAERLCLFAQQLLGERLDAERDRAFAEITRSIDEAEDIKAILERVANAALDLTAASFSSIEYPDGDWLSTQAVKSNPETLEKRTHYQPVQPGKPGRGVTGYVHASGKPLIVGHRDLEADTFEGFQMLEGMVGALAEAAVPIHFKDRAYGVINVESEVPYFFAERHVAVLERLAALAGIAISTADRLDRAEHEVILASVFRGIGHEANNHSAAIALRVGLTQRYLDTGGCDESKVRASLRIIGDEAQAISLMVDDFRWLAKPEERQAALKISLQTIIAEALDRLPNRLDPTVAARLIRPVADLVRVEMPNNPALIVCGRPGLLRRVVENLLQNAWEAVIDQKEPQAGDVLIRLFTEEQQVAIIEVLDRGPGLPNGDEVFQPYYTTKGAKGLGLGLAIAKKVIEAHQGSIRGQRRDDGEGACFRIELPRASSAPGVSLGTNEDRNP